MKLVPKSGFSFSPTQFAQWFCDLHRYWFTSPENIYFEKREIVQNHIAEYLQHWRCSEGIFLGYIENKVDEAIHDLFEVIE